MIGAIVVAVFVGLRTSYNDTYTYRNMYESLDAGFGNIASLSFSLGDNPGFWITNTILKTLGCSTQKCNSHTLFNCSHCKCITSHCKKQKNKRW